MKTTRRNNRKNPLGAHARLQQFAAGSTFIRRPWVWVVAALCAMALVAGMLIPALLSAREERLTAEQVQRITVQPQQSGPLGMAQGSALAIRAPGLSRRAIENSLRLSPGLEYKLERGADGEYLLVPQSAFEAGQIVNLTFNDFRGRTLKSWAFQTEMPFTVTNLLPGDGETYVPVNTGIEFRFSNPGVTEEAFREHLTVTPQVQGHVEKFGSTLAFVPENGLEKNTLYTFTLDGALSAGEGVTLGEDVTLHFRTSYYDETSYYRPPTLENASRLSESYLPGDPVVLELRAYGEGNDYFFETPLRANIYAYPSPEAYSQALAQLAGQYNQPLGYTETISLPTEGLALRSTFTTRLEKSENYYGTGTVVLPDELPEGWYLVELEVKNPVAAGSLTVQKLVQVSPVSVFHAQVREDITFWVNNAGDGTPFAGAQVQVEGEAFRLSGQTDGEGVLSASTQLPQEETRRTSVLTITAGDKRYLDIIERAGSGALSASQKYYSYLTTDRTVYLGSDTIQFWGVAQPRRGEYTLPGTLTVSLGGLYETQVAVAPDGSFTGKLSYEKLGTRNRGGLDLSLMLGEEPLSSCWVRIYNYRKPVYSTSLTADKVIFENPLSQPVGLEFTASFFDGTPAARLPVRMEYNTYTVKGSDENSVELTTDSGGAARWEFTLSPQEDRTEWRPATASVWVQSNQPEGEYYSHYGQVNLAFRDVMLTGEPTATEGETQLLVKANTLDFSGITEESQLQNPENYTGAPYDGAVTGVLYRTYYEPVPNGQYYDFIQKRYVTSYQYQYREEEVRTLSGRTAGGELTFTGLPVSDGQNAYYVALSIPDRQGRETTEQVWLGGRAQYYGYYNEQYRFALQREEEGNRFADGEALAIRVEHSQRVSGEGRVLWAIAQEGLRDVTVSPSLEFTLPFAEQNIPNFVLTGAFFDGRRVQLISDLYLSYDPQQRELSVQVQSDKESYDHGEEAKITLTVTGPDGKPAAGASVEAAVVDEAVFAMLDQYADPLGSFYQSVWYPNILRYISYHDYNNPGTAGEKGGGGGEGTRTDFRDTAAFFTGTTDNSGQATFTFTLPDSLTSWRITAQAVQGGRYLGRQTKNIVTTGSFFLQPVAPQTVLVGDDLVVGLRAHGVGIADDAAVEYTLTLKGEGYEQSASAKGNADQFSHIQLETPPKGDYTLVLEGRSGELYDGIEQPLTVAESGAEVATVRSFDLAQGLELSPERFPVKLALYNNAYRFYSQVVAHLTQNAYGPRADQQLAQLFLAQQLAGEGETLPSADALLESLFDSDGGVRLLSYGEPDVPFSARVHAAAPQYLPQGENTDLFLWVVSNTQSDPQELCAAYMGLAAHKEPVLLEVQALLENPKNLSQRCQLDLVAALALLGAYDQAIHYYSRIITPALVTAQDAAGNETAHLELGGDPVEAYESTAAASIAASVLGTKDAEPLMRYLIQSGGSTGFPLLEEMVFLRCFVPETTEMAKVSYTLEGRRHTLELAPCEQSTLTLSARQLQNLNLQVVSGQVGAQANYTASAAEAREAPNQNLTVHKTIEPLHPGEKMAVNSVLRVTLRVVVPDNFIGEGLVVDDYIPTGARYIGTELPFGAWSDDGQEGQKVRFSTGYRFGPPQQPSPAEPLNPREEQNPSTTWGEDFTQEPFDGTIVYYIRCVAPGMYLNESAYAVCPENGVWGMSDRGVVLIDKE